MLHRGGKNPQSPFGVLRVLFLSLSVVYRYPMCLSARSHSRRLAMKHDGGPSTFTDEMIIIAIIMVIIIIVIVILIVVIIVT